MLRGNELHAQGPTDGKCPCPVLHCFSQLEELASLPEETGNWTLDGKVRPRTVPYIWVCLREIIESRVFQRERVREKMRRGCSWRIPLWEPSGVQELVVRKSLGGPVAKNLPANAGDTGSFLVGEARSHVMGAN